MRLRHQAHASSPSAQPEGDALATVIARAAEHVFERNTARHFSRIKNRLVRD